VRTLSWKAAAWAGGATIAAAGVGVGVYAAVAHGTAGTAARPATAAAHARPQPLRLVSVTPADGNRAVDGADDITVTFNQPLPASAALPQLSPAVAGTWQREGDTAVFTPQTGIRAGTTETVMVSEGDGGGRSGQFSFTTAAYSTLRLQELLAQLGYLPMTWTPDVGAAIPDGSATAQLAAAYEPPPGTFTWHSGYPSSLRSFWREGSANTLDEGAITGFEADHGLPADGVASPKMWAALLSAAAAGADNQHGYSYAITSQAIPETLTIWHDGRQVFSSPANTGISAAPTPVGTFPVYEKLPFQVMQGTNPDGSHYADPVQWVSYFEGGSAVHYIARGSYGYPQSLGCVELPYSAAEEAYPYLPYGTLVTVTP
jgi:peptidoglycan hydrolase-like protein with peptidoglycan-binding domain